MRRSRDSRVPLDLKSDHSLWTNAASSAARSTSSLFMDPSTPGVGALVGQEQALLRYMSVDLRCFQADVAKQFLHMAQIGAVVQEVRGERVAERVGMQRCGRAAIEHPPDVARGEAPAHAVE